MMTREDQVRSDTETVTELVCTLQDRAKEFAAKPNGWECQRLASAGVALSEFVRKMRDRKPIKD